MKRVGFSSIAWNKSSERSNVARSAKCVAICHKQADRSVMSLDWPMRDFAE